jgi:hypothetical protein
LAAIRNHARQGQRKANGCSQVAGAGNRPIICQKRSQREKRIKNNNTFEAVAREWHEKKKGGWSSRYAATLLMQLEANLLPQLGKLPIGEITTPVLLDALQQLEKARRVYEITRKAKQMCGQIFRYAIPKGMAARDYRRSKRRTGSQKNSSLRIN